ncbi:LOW QUALITY PROTEIN: uncharacterized protein LOC115374818 [Xyrichtys novacula]|uniref:LOW QUALITY PROTEIN: uncharacterized protein LOC115374818 n=1 Tax=Xyrichtys novacula TaxID=13765 RepID=A0AAV1GJV6_XYRNO|nr:LOW QUALITY PROTEIN: uncharacterized protein LOC115374818 [Xyrichtys novacula]
MELDLNFCQHCHFPTHNHDHILDLISSTGLTGLTIYLQLYTDHLHQYKATLSSASSAYYSNIIRSGSSNPRTLFSTINSLLAPHDNSTATFTPDKCQTFLQFFQSKIDNICSLQSATSTPTPHPKSPSCSPHTSAQPLSQFSPISHAQLSQLITTMKTSTCTLDPMPSALVKTCLPVLSPLILSIV